MTFGSGRRISVLIFSTSMMKEVYLAPIEYYDPDMIFVLLSNRKDEQSQLENEIYLSVKSQIQCNKIKEYELDTHDFDAVTGTLLEIKRNLRSEVKDTLDIFFNISSGTNEYAAASLFAAMTPPTDTAFNVIIEDNGLSKDEMRTLLGDREHVISDPSIMTMIDKSDPDDEMIALLSVLKEMLKVSKYTRHEDIIEGLKRYGEWSYDEYAKSNNKRTELDEKEDRYLTRHYLDRARANNWIENITSRKIAITRKGEAYLEVCRGRGLSDMTVCSDMCRTREYNSMYIEPVRKKRKGKDALVVEHNGKSYRFTLNVK